VKINVKIVRLSEALVSRSPLDAGRILPEGRGVNDLLGNVQLMREPWEVRGRVLGEGRGVNGLLMRVFLHARGVVDRF
jgi:hypothetical protein